MALVEVELRARDDNNVAWHEVAHFDLVPHRMVIEGAVDTGAEPAEIARAVLGHLDHAVDIFRGAPLAVAIFADREVAGVAGLVGAVRRAVDGWCAARNLGPSL